MLYRKGMLYKNQNKGDLAESQKPVPLQSRN